MTRTSNQAGSVELGSVSAVVDEVSLGWGTVFVYAAWEGLYCHACT